MKTNCQQCGKEFEAKPCHVASGRAKACSPECRYSLQRKTETRPCSYCGSPITRRPSLFLGEIAYCNSTCRNKHVAAKNRPEVQFEGDIVLIPLSQGQWAKVDREDYDSIPMLRDEMWSAMWVEGAQTFYAIRREDGVGILMHRVITGVPEDLEVHHRDYNGCTNTRENITICTHQENLQNRRKGPDMGGVPATSKHKGVHFSQWYGQWVARIQNKYIGRFDTEVAAAIAYNAAAAATYGEFAQLNDVD